MERWCEEPASAHRARPGRPEVPAMPFRLVREGSPAKSPSLPYRGYRNDEPKLPQRWAMIPSAASNRNRAITMKRQPAQPPTIRLKPYPRPNPKPCLTESPTVGPSWGLGALQYGDPYWGCCGTPGVGRANLVPQDGQNAAPGPTGAPHDGQRYHGCVMEGPCFGRRSHSTLTERRILAHQRTRHGGLLDYNPGHAYVRWALGGWRT
jgi:hypothetical protein